jgi:GNAT superfamily N-acetyltransferase
LFMGSYSTKISTQSFNCGGLLTVMYSPEPDLSPAEFIDMLVRSTLAEHRPVHDINAIRAMLKNADLILTTRRDGLLVGVSRAITDFAFCTYLSDLAVDQDYQRQGIGRELIRRTHEAAGLHTTLLVAPKVRKYHAKGTKLLKLFKNGRCSDKGRMQREAAKQGIARTTIYRYVALAREYPGKKVQALAGLSWKAVKMLLQVKDRKTRSQLRRRIIAGELPTSALATTIRQLEPRRPARGGQLRPGELQEDLLNLSEKTRKWLHHVDRVWLAGHQTKLGNESEKGSKQARLLKAAQAAMRKLMDSLK